LVGWVDIHQDQTCFSCSELCKIPLMSIRTPDTEPVPRSQTKLQETSSQQVYLLLQLCEVPPDVLLADHEPLPVSEGVGRDVDPLSDGNTHERGGARSTHIAPVTGMVHLGLLRED